MEAMIVTTGLVLIIAAGLLSSYLDAKYQWRLNDWFSGRCTNPFIVSEKSALRQQLADKDEKIDALSKRIATLEAIVTEPAYELKQKINALK